MQDDVFFEETQSTDTETNYETSRNKPMPSYNHGSIQANIIIQIGKLYDEKYRPVSELTLKLNDWISVPDISIYPFEMLDTDNDSIKTTTPPLCAIEILSPKQSLSDLLLKARTYFEKEVKSCWLVLPGVNNIYVFSNAKEYEIFKTGETLFDQSLDMKIEVSRVFR